MTLPVRFGVAHDFRCPPGSAYSLQDVYAQTIEQIQMLDELGLDQVWFSEHHFVDDGYLPSFAPVAGAAAAVTRRMRISTNISIVPFSHPLRLAEDLAVLDQLSGGRMEFGVGLGYASCTSSVRSAFRSPNESHAPRSASTSSASPGRESGSPTPARGSPSTMCG